jgi:hypothetical protein
MEMEQTTLELSAATGRKEMRVFLAAAYIV